MISDDQLHINYTCTHQLYTIHCQGLIPRSPRSGNETLRSLALLMLTHGCRASGAGSTDLALFAHWWYLKPYPS